MVELCPESGPEVVGLGSAYAAVNHSVGGKIFTEIRHPSGRTEIDHVGLDLLLVPAVSIRIGQVHMAAVELAEIDEVVLTRGVLNKIALLHSLVAKALSLYEIWIYVDCKGNITFLEFFNPFIKARIHLRIPLPVPKNSLSERCDDLPRPVLGPQAADAHIVGQRFLQLGTNRLRTALHSQDNSVMDP